MIDRMHSPHLPLYLVNLVNPVQLFFSCALRCAKKWHAHLAREFTGATPVSLATAKFIDEERKLFCGNQPHLYNAATQSRSRLPSIK